MKIIINGLGVAGPALAFWLTKSGHKVLLVEQAPALRRGGYVVDFWGIGYDIVEKMGLSAEIRRLGYQVREVRYVGDRGEKRGGFGVGVFGRLTNDRFTSVPRSDVSATIYHAIECDVETIFGDSIAGIHEHGNGVHVNFDHAPPRNADLVIGADGQHSRVRQLAFGPESALEVSLGYHVGAFETEGYGPRDELVYISHDRPGRQLSRFSMRDDKTMFLFVMRDEYLRGGDPKAILRNVFSGAGWEWPRIESSIAPKTSFGISFRNTVTKLMRVPFVADYVVGRSLRDEIELPDYDFAPAAHTGRAERQ